jgi:hypothetical protein
LSDRATIVTSELRIRARRVDLLPWLRLSRVRRLSGRLEQHKFTTRFPIEFASRTPDVVVRTMFFALSLVCTLHHPWSL